MYISFLEGFLAGLAVAMPMGAIGVLCLRYILVQGKIPGFAAGLGIALADGVTAFICSLGLTAIISFIKNQDIWMNIIGSLILIGFGVHLLLTKKTPEKKNTEKGFFHITFLMFLITITNPLTIVSFAGIFAALGLDSLENHLSAVAALTTGVFLGSMSWWLLLIGLSLFFKITEDSARLINEIAGSLLILIGIVSFLLLFIPI
ncbi:MAG TPA: LysE family transporter [Parachlamydiaceae bacterium]|nr:LysE family transporter [Parachlamydiaceae bacterium]